MKIAKKKLEMPVSNGGLGIWSTDRRASALFLNSLMRNAAYINQNPDSNLALICECANFPFFKFLNLFGSNCLEGSPKFIKNSLPDKYTSKIACSKGCGSQQELKGSVHYF